MVCSRAGSAYPLDLLQKPLKEHGERMVPWFRVQATLMVAETLSQSCCERSGLQPSFELDCATPEPLF